MNFFSPYRPLKALLSEMVGTNVLTVLDLGIGKGNYWDNEMFKTSILEKKILVTGMDMTNGYDQRVACD